MRGLGRHVADAYRNLRHGGPDVIREFLSRAYFGAVPSVDPDPVYAEDWDLLIVLDACRADLFDEVVADGSYEGLCGGESRISAGSTSTEWLEGVFGDADPDDLRDTAYITGNPYSESHLDREAFGLVDEVWRYAWDDDLGTIPARPLTDRTIAVGRERSFDRMVVHYMQPHFPSIPDGDRDNGVTLGEFGDESMSVWEELRFGQRTESEVWESYRANLEYVLDEVGLLLDHVDAERVVVTADHGNAVGEAGLYGHAEGVALPCLREVPWCKTTATDRQVHEPAQYDATATTGTTAARLESLGYA
ncbi:hypothetical protein BRC80_09010 [Halobacteriales archaeon QH_9_66_26]|nr:MAG: hypothetical protein BRC80_09010 [Halobacteriales archaeon QH_9_66_26]